MSTATKHSAAYRLFNFRYPIYLPQMFMYGAEYLRKNGYAITGDARLDQERLTQISLINQTPAGMAILAGDGAYIGSDSFRTPEDVVPVYENIQEHLKDWERVIRFGAHVDDIPPLDDFRGFESIAISLYESAKFYEPEERTHDPLRDKLMEMNRRRSPVPTRNFLKDRLKDKDGNMKPYESIVDRIERMVLGGEVWR
jgi:hypothetical protein